MVVATHNFTGVEELLAKPSPPAAQYIEALGNPEARMLLRNQVSELNRWYFVVWERFQLGLGVLLLLVLFLGADGKPFMLVVSLLMLVAAVLQHWLLTPEIVRLGRAIDFVPLTAPSSERTRFWNFHTAYSTTEVLKLLLGFFLTVRLLTRRRRRVSEFPDEIDRIDDADDGHVNG